MDTSIPVSVTFALSTALKDGWFGGYTGCDSLGGSYQANGDQLSVTAPQVTQDGCDDPAAATQAEQFIAILDGAHRSTVYGEHLTITGDNGAATFTNGRY